MKVYSNSMFKCVRYICVLAMYILTAVFVTGCGESTENNVTLVKSERKKEAHPEVLVKEPEKTDVNDLENKDSFEEIKIKEEKKIFTENASLAISSLKNSTSKNSNTLTASQSEVAANALDILKENEGSYSRPLRVVYFNPADRKPISGFQQRIEKIMFELREFYRTGMKRNGYGDKTFDLETKGKNLVIHMVKSKQPKNYFSRDGEKAAAIKSEIAHYFQKEEIDIEKETVLVFQNLARIEKNRFYDTDAPYFGSWNTNKNRKGFCYVVDSKYLNWKFLSSDKGKIQFNGNRTFTLGELASGQIGGVCHELGHAFCLNHTCGNKVQNDRLGTSLMGYGNWTFKEEMRQKGRGTYLSFACATKLAGHPCFTAIKRGSNDFQMTDISLNSMSSILEVNGSVHTNTPIYAVLAYCDDINKPSDYDATSWVGSVDRVGNFQLSINELENSSSYRLTLQFLHINGNQSTEMLELKTDEYGIPLIEEESREKILLKPIIKAAMQKDREKTENYLRILTSTSNDKAINFLADTIKVMNETPATIPNTVSPNISTIYLSQLKWKSAYTGYNKPRSNSIHEDNNQSPWPFLASGDNIHRFGLYAHANSEYVYQLDSTWKTLEGKCSLKKNMKGSVIFTIYGDGEKLYDSGIVRDSREKSFKVNVSGIKEIKLSVTDAGDGKNSDWGLWLSPRLLR